MSSIIYELRDGVARVTLDRPPLNILNIAAIQELERVLGTRVKITGKPDERGHIEITYYSPEDLQRIYALIVGEER